MLIEVTQDPKTLERNTQCDLQQLILLNLSSGQTCNRGIGIETPKVH